MNEIKLKEIPISKLEFHFQNFVDFKRSIGLKYNSETKTFRYFAKYCRQNYQTNNLPENAIFDWLNESDNRSMKTKSNYCGTMTEWAKYMFSIGFIQLRIPNIRYSRNTAFVPHIFTNSEMNSIWKVVDNIEVTKRYPNLHRCIPVLFRLLYSCGLRISEALYITRKDIDFNKNVVAIRKAKFDKVRWIPLSDSMSVVLKKYLTESLQNESDDAPIFYYRYGEPLTVKTVYGRFRLTLSQSNIPYEGKLRGPRLHDFRHTFAVMSMNQLNDGGFDLYVYLPILSSYLGHSSISSTERYLRLTEERLSLITKSIQLNLANVFPEVKQDEEL